MVEVHIKRMCIVTHSYMLPDGSGRSVGGTQSYTDSLIRLFQPLCDEIIVLQVGDGFEVVDQPGVKVIGRSGGGKELAGYHRGYIAPHADMTINLYFPWAHLFSGRRLIAVQHGIGWDGYISRYSGVLGRLRKAHYLHYQLPQIARMHRRNVKHCDRVVSVDLNFQNWLRALFPVDDWEEKLVYIPNCGDPVSAQALEEKLSSEPEKINVLISRRFQLIRGLPLMAEIVADIYDDWPDVEYVFAGCGAQQEKMEKILEGKDRCVIKRLEPGEIPAANYRADIAVVPTIFSEGTSFSCVEAMCAGAAVVSTSIGGLGNLILPDYNGILVAPKASSIREGLEKVLGDAELRRTLARRAYETARVSFSREAWNRRFLKAVSELF